MHQEQPQNVSQNKSVLQYYQTKVDELYKERLRWLAKFDQCNSKLQSKQQKMADLKKGRDDEVKLFRSIVHHDAALIDQKINVIRKDREKMGNQYKQAEQIIRMEELKEEFPEELEKHVPCRSIYLNDDLINNELNIHHKKSGKSKQNKNKKNFNTQFGETESNKPMDKIKYKSRPTAEDLLKRQIVDLKTNQQAEICSMTQLSNKLDNLIKTVKGKQQQSLQKQRNIIQQFKKETKKLDQRYKNLAENYFSTKKKLKEDGEKTVQQNIRLKNILKNLSKKVDGQMKIYEKQNKAKQTLIIKKSEDFQEDCNNFLKIDKARMRAKQRNLQALRDNYEKMQEVCIQKIKNLERTVGISRAELSQSEKRRNYLVTDLREKLNILEKKVQDEKIEKAKIDIKLKQNIERQRKKKEQEYEREQQQKILIKKAKMIEEAYKKTKIIPRNLKSKSKSKDKVKQKNKKQPKPQNQQESDEQSMAMSDLQNIRHQINELESKIEVESKKKK